MSKFLYCLLLIICMVACDSNDEVKKTDAEYKKYIVGSWVDSPKDPLYGSGGHVTEYREDGTLTFRMYTDVKCTILESETEGIWDIKNGILEIEVTETNSKNLGAGLKVSDKIIDINDKEQILVLYGVTIYRIRSETCI